MKKLEEPIRINITLPRALHAAAQKLAPANNVSHFIRQLIDQAVVMAARKGTA